MCQVRLLQPWSDRDRFDRLRPVVESCGAQGAAGAAAEVINAAMVLPGACIRVGVDSESAGSDAVIESALAPGDIALRWGGGESAVLKAGASQTEAWLWCEELLARAGDGPKRDRAPMVIGLAAAATHSPPAELYRRADAALHLARSRGGSRVCTWEMIGLDSAAREIGSCAGLTPEARRQRLIGRLAAAGELGPTQREHLTSHCERVGLLAARLASWMGERRREVEGARLSGLMHDIGKAAVPEDILAKPSSLSAAERAVLDRHTDEGAALGDRLGLDADISRSILHHHTRFDAGDGPCAEVPLAALIVGVADAFVAMTTDRPYRAACTTTAALAELRRHRGRQFDPVVVDAAVSMLGAGAVRVAA